MWPLLAVVACTSAESPHLGGSSEDTGEGGPPPLEWLHDYWTPTAAICQPPDPFESPYTWEPYREDACQEALRADLKVDMETFDSDPTGATAIDRLTRGAFYLLGRDLGTVAALDELTDDDDTWAIREPFIEQVQAVAAEMDEEEVRPAVYNLVMSTILCTEYWPDLDENAKFLPNSRTLAYFGAGNPDAEAALQVHEAAHGWQDVWHVACPEGHEVDGRDYSGEKDCDADWNGAWAFQAAAARLMYLGVPEEASDASTWQEGALAQVELATSFILAE